MAEQNIRNIAIIAHVDHGKTTLVDKIIACCSEIDTEKRSNMLDDNELEKERGITILSKNVSVNYKNTKINMLDTPGHADFGGEVERVLKMADGVLLLVDAFEGPMPQTKFVLGKAISLDLNVIVVINKVDKENCKPDETQEKVFDIMFELNANEKQLEFKTIYGSSKQGWMSTQWENPTDNIYPLLDMILEEIPSPKNLEGNTQLQITSLTYSKFLGRIAIGRVYRGNIKENTAYILCTKEGNKNIKVKEIFVFEGNERKKISEVHGGDICAVSGIDDFEIGDTIADIDKPEKLPRIHVDEPTMQILFTINNSPFYGKEGKFVTSKHLRNRLLKETEKNLALIVKETMKEDTFEVYGRGVLHLSILIETMRREGYEFQVGKPKVIFKTIDNVKHEPIETLVIDTPEEYSGKIIEAVTQRKGEMTSLESTGNTHNLEFIIPSRGIIGLTSKLLIISCGEAIINHKFKEFSPYKGDIQSLKNGALISMETGKAIAFAIDRLKDRGVFFIDPGQEIYTGQVIGEHNKQNDMTINVHKGKKLTNMRSSGSDDNVKIPPKKTFSLEEYIEYLRDDEYLEVTPENLRVRKINM